MTSDRYHHGDLRNALVRAAIEMVKAAGADAFSLRGVAREVGVSANAVYRHFPDRSALLGEVARVGFQELGERMHRGRKRGALGESASVRAFKATGRAYVEFAVDEPALFRLMFGEHRASRAEVSPPHPTPYEVLSRSLDALEVDGEIALREGAETVAWSAVHGFASLQLCGAVAFPSARARRRALDRLLEHTLGGLRSEGGTPHG
ncbi:MAG: TetR/AcrR family transcriptional regulator [Sandaracinaceae bacterium]